MRVLKFRAWDKTNSEYFEDGNTFDLNYSGTYGSFFFDNDHPGNMRDVNLEWEQYTGLEDEEDAEIYEGDIVCMSIWNGGDGANEPDETDYFQGPIEWCSGGFVVHDPNHGEIALMEINAFVKYERLGTIHDKESK